MEKGVYRMVDEKVVEKPWGHYPSVRGRASLQSKKHFSECRRAVVPLQAHEHRAENWIVVHGTANVIRGP